MKTFVRVNCLVLLATIKLLSNSAYASDKTDKKADLKQINLQAENPQYNLLEKELNRYTDIQAKGGWKKIASGKKHYSKGESFLTILQVKQRLQASGDMEADTSRIFTDVLEQAVMKVQKQLGFKVNGVIDHALIKELNVSVEQRINQLRVNMERLRAAPPETGGTRLVANIPEFTLHVYEGANHVFDMPIVVGSEANKTVIFNDTMKQVIFSPYWNVPPSIVKTELLPAMRKHPGYLRKNNYEQVGVEDGLPKIRQKPGPKNALGLVKFLFPNSHAIYFHDTPSKTLFELRKRAFSHGCIRLSQPAKLAQYLLRDNPEWTPAKIDLSMHGGKEQVVNLQAPAAVAITYFTAWVDKEGLLHFREDVYGLDKEVAKQLAGL